MKPNDFPGLRRFWGLSTAAVKNLIVNEGIPLFLAGVAELKVHADLSGGSPYSFRAFFPAAYRGDAAGTVLASFSINGENFPAVSLAGDKVVFHFDPEETAACLLEERYFRWSRPLYSRLPVHYHLVPGVLRLHLNRLMIALRERNLSRTSFPTWYEDYAVEEIRKVFLQAVKLAGCKEDPKPFWPNGKRFAIVITHDLDTPAGYRRIDAMRKIERSYGLKSSWNAVGKHISSHRRELESLKREGNEIGSHGLLHNLKEPFLNISTLRDNLRRCRDGLADFDAVGYRSPSLQRSGNLFELLPEFFTYDSSVPDTEIFSAVGPRNGCTSIFPFFKGELVELPLTMPQDALLQFLSISPQGCLQVWRKKLSAVRSRGGLALFNFHPDRHFSGNPRMLKVIDELLAEAAAWDDAWFALPREVYRWWVERDRKPAEEAR